jgi:SAM-dependent methyltransferase
MIRYYTNSFILIVLLIFFINQSFAETKSSDTQSLSLSEDKFDLLLCGMNNGEYGHVGGANFINIILNKARALSPEIIQGNCLSFNGGSEDEIDLANKHGFSNIWNIVTQEKVIEQAKIKYPNIHFKRNNPLQITHVYEDDSFNFIYLINIASTVSDKVELLQKLKAVCKDDGFIAISDLVAKDNSYLTGLYDFNGQPIFPINVKKLSLILEAIGWKIVGNVDMTEDYLFWYSSALEFITARKDLLIAIGFSDQEVDYTYKFFSDTLELIKTDKIGGILIFAQKI